MDDIQLEQVLAFAKEAGAIWAFSVDTRGRGSWTAARAYVGDEVILTILPDYLAPQPHSIRVPAAPDGQFAGQFGTKCERGVYIPPQPMRTLP